MAHNKLYRNFIILQEDERGYSHTNDKSLSGYAKIEAKGDKCKVSFYAQNLIPEDTYSMVLICCKRDLKQLINIGPLAINEVGKGDTSKEYYVNNIAGLGISYEKISGAAICRIKNNENDFVMHGFMNGEDSVENWRKFKFIKADSPKYFNKADSEIFNKDVHNINIEAQVINKPINASKLVEELAERNKDEIKLNKENIEFEEINYNDSKINEEENRIQESYANISETKDNISEDRKKCKESKKDDKQDKHDKCDKCEEYKNYKCDKYDVNKNYENTEEILSKLGNNLDNYEGIMDIKMNHNIDADVIVYGFIKKKNDHNSKWKKFKMEKKCKTEGQEFKGCHNYKRLEENFNLDKINEANNCGNRLDLIDFDKYENEIKKIKPSAMGAKALQMDKGNAVNQTVGESGNTETGQGTVIKKITKIPETPETTEAPKIPETNNGTVEKIPETPETTGETINGTVDQGPKETTKINTGNMNQIKMGKTGNNIGAVCQIGTGDMWKSCPSCDMNKNKIENMNQYDSNMKEQLDLSDGEPFSIKKVQQALTNKFNINGSVGKYFEKIAEAFTPYLGNLTDVNYCNWYKFDVNSIEDLSDESNYNQYTLAYYPMLNYYPYISKAGHFLLGYKCNKNGDMKYIIYAIPGTKEKNDQPYGGRTGFVTWTDDSDIGRGYWLMFYDFKNSSIVIPTR